MLFKRWTRAWSDLLPEFTVLAFCRWYQSNSVIALVFPLAGSMNPFTQCKFVMPSMHFPHISALDLNLVEPLFALLEERHVTRAARRCGMSQSAMSRALDRLRIALKDKLLVRSDGAYTRTPRGDQLLIDLQDLLPRLDAAMRGNRFDSATSSEYFHIATTDYAASILIPRLLERVATVAPNVRIDVGPWNNKVFNDIEAGRIHLAVIGVQPPEPFESEPLFSDEFVCVVAEDHPLRAARLTLKRYVEYGHAVVAVGKNGDQPWIESALAANGFKRLVAYRSPYQLSAILGLAQHHDLHDGPPPRYATGPRGQRSPPGRAPGTTEDRLSHDVAPSSARRRSTELAAKADSGDRQRLLAQRMPRSLVQRITLYV